MKLTTTSYILILQMICVPLTSSEHQAQSAFPIQPWHDVRLLQPAASRNSSFMQGNGIHIKLTICYSTELDS